MRKILLTLALLSLPSIWYWNQFVEILSWDIKLQYINYNIKSDSYDLKTRISIEAKDLSSISRDFWAISGINWAFFCPEDYSTCGGKNYTINERFIEGRDLSFYSDTGERAVFWWDSDTLPFLHQTDKINKDNRWNIFEWLWNFPVLFSNWVNQLEYYHDIWLYDSKMSANMPRHFICSNREKTHIFFWRSTATSLDALAPALYNIGCWDGINLDAWASSHLNYNWRELVVWKRKILDWFFIVPKEFETKDIHTSVDISMRKLVFTLNSYTQQRKIDILLSLREYIKNYRNTIYESYSQDIIDSSWASIWYTLEITDTNSLKTVYTLNLLDMELKKLYDVYMKNDN